MRTIINAFFLLSGFLFSANTGRGQLIIAAEYFVNTDPGVGQGVPIGGVLDIFTITKSFDVPLVNFHAGFNQLFIRVEDQNLNWSIAEQRSFFVDNSLGGQLFQSAEYFFDTDPGVGLGNHFTIPSRDSVSSLINIPADLPGGFHQLFIRVQDQNDEWSIAEQRTFYIDMTLNRIAPLLTAAEYFIDTDPGVGQGSPYTIQRADSVGSLIGIPANLAIGFHQLFIRVKDQNDHWSIAEQRTFHVDNDFYINVNLSKVSIPIIAAEYFISVDSGVGHNTAIPVIKGDTVNGSYNYFPGQLPPGNYTMNLRVEDSVGNWSIVESRPFTITSVVAVGLSNFLLKCNYNQVVLSWQTAAEINSRYFDIQKSSDGVHWKLIGQVSAAGNSGLLKNYAFTDVHNGGMSSYRLRQVDQDGKFIYSETLKSYCTSSLSQVQVYPIPSRNEVNVFIETKNSCTVDVLLIDNYGNIIRKVHQALLKGVNAMSLDVSNVAPGGYYLKVTGIEGLATQKIIVSH